MEEETTILQLTNLLSGIMRRIHGKPLDKDAKQSFKYMSPENRAEKGRDGLHETATQTENDQWTESTNSPNSSPQS